MSGTSPSPKPKDYADSKFIQDALTGPSKKLVDHILTSKSCDTSLTCRLVHLIDPDLIPRRLDRPEAFKNVIAAKEVISVIFTQCRVIFSEGVGSKAMAELLGTHSSALLEWFRFFIDHRPRALVTYGTFSLLTIAHFLHLMVVTHEGLENVIMSSTLALDIIINIWSKKSEHGRYISGGGRGGSCPVIGLLRDAVTNELGMDTLLVLSHTTPRVVSKVIPTIMDRIEELADHHFDSSYAIRRLLELVNLARTLIRPSSPFPRHLLPPLRSPDFIRTFALTIHAVLGRHMDPFPLDEVTVFLKLIGDLILCSDGSRANPLKMVEAALDSGIYSIITTATRYSLPSPRLHSFFLSFLSEVATYAIYPEISLSLMTAVTTALQSFDHEDEDFSVCWDMITRWGNRRKSSGRKDSKIQGTRCDYIHHGTSAEVGRSKKCSKCHTAVYCSRHCQTLDWNHEHRNECGSSFWYKTKVHRISPRIVAAQARFIQDLFSDKFQDIDRLYASGSGSVPCLARIDGHLLPINGSLVLVDDIRKRVQTNGDTVHDLSTELMGDSTLYAVDAWLPWGGYTIHLLVRLKRFAKDDFRLLTWALMDVCPTIAVDPRQNSISLF